MNAIQISELKSVILSAMVVLLFVGVITVILYCLYLLDELQMAQELIYSLQKQIAVR